MSKRHRLLVALLATPLVVMMATIAFARSPHGRAGAPQCPLDCGVKLEHGPWVCTDGRVVKAVCLSAGRERFSLTENGTDGCYTVTGLGTANATVTDSGRHKHCKDISSVVFYFDCSGGLFPG